MSDKYNTSFGILSLDWLEFGINSFIFSSFEGRELIELPNSNIVLELQKRHPRNFSHRYKVYFEGYEIAELCCLPVNQAFMKSTYGQIKISNHLLYGTYYWHYIDAILKDLGAVFQNVTRLDIACDTKNLQSEITDLLHDVYVLKNKPYLNFDKQSGKDVDYVRIGRRTAHKHLVIYDKEKELKKSGKKYIRKVLSDNGLNIAANGCSRIELRLNSTIFNRYKQFDFQDLKSSDCIKTIFNQEVQGLLSAYRPEGKKRYKDCEKMEYVPINLKSARRLRKVDKHIPKAIFRKKMAIKSLCEEQFIGNESDSALFLAYKMAQNYDLVEWLDEKYPEWVKYWEALYKKVGLSKDAWFLECESRLGILKFIFDDLKIRNNKDAEQNVFSLYSKGIPPDEIMKMCREPKVKEIIYKGYKVKQA